MQIQYKCAKQLAILLAAVLFSAVVTAQTVKKYGIKDGRMVVELSKNLPGPELDAFIKTFDLADLDLKNFLKTGKADSLQRMGWNIDRNDAALVIISKPLFSFDILSSPSDWIRFAEKFPLPGEFMGEEPPSSEFGYNRFRHDRSFTVNDSIVFFHLRNHRDAKRVLLAGSFSNWQEHPLAMKATDSGWVAEVKLAPGKYWYKFIVDGNWITDPDNQQNENDAEANTNSVYYKTNHRFYLPGLLDEKKVYLAGSFNNWRDKNILMHKTATGWELGVLLPEGTHTYKFVVDGDWLTDPNNHNRLPDGYGSENAVIRLGKAHVFQLDGFRDAKQVVLSGSFNGWREDELLMQKTATGWELPYVIGAGNYQYKFIVDGKWITDPTNPLKGADDNSFLVIEPNYTFRLHAPSAKRVTIAGDFNGWNPDAAMMKKDGNDWIFQLHLNQGKHRYKFIVDGNWILDPGNKLWEENEYGTGNSILWIE